MTISDQKLCAFIDNELPDEEMEQIRDSIISDETISDRIAELSMVDHVVSSTIHAIDDKPLPQSTEALLNQSRDNSSSKVVELSLWRKVSHTVREHTAMAAVFVLALGLSIVTYLGYDSNSEAPHWQLVSQTLSSTASDTTVSLDEQWELHLQASFISKNDHYCRLFALQSKTTAYNNIACRDNGAWQLHSRMPVTPSSTGDYQTASVDSKLDNLIESMIKGSFLNQDQEEVAINNNWQAKN